MLIDDMDINQRTLNTCLSSDAPDTYLAQNEMIARSVNIQAVPAVFIDERQIRPPSTLSGWEQLLDLN